MTMHTSRNKAHLMMALSIIFIHACSSGQLPDETIINNSNELEQVSPVEVDLDALNQEIEYILKELPTPVSMISVIDQRDLNFDQHLANKISKISAYENNHTKSVVNLGIYLSDIVYLSAFEKNQEVIIYLDQSKVLAEKIGVLSAFDVDIMNDYKEKLGDVREITSLVNESIDRTANILRTEERSESSVSFLVGAYVEAFYITSGYIAQKNNLSDESGPSNSSLWVEMIHQREAFNRLMDLGKSVKDDDTFSQRLKADLSELQELYNEIELDENNELVNNEPAINFFIRVQTVRDQLVRA